MNYCGFIHYGVIAIGLFMIVFAVMFWFLVKNQLEILRKLS